MDGFCPGKKRMGSYFSFYVKKKVYSDCFSAASLGSQKEKKKIFFSLHKLILHNPTNGFVLLTSLGSSQNSKLMALNT